MKKVKWTIAVILLGITLYSCNSEKTNEKSTSDTEEQQIINTMQQTLDTNNAEVVMERDTTK
ncbi:MAG TPA: hypothetical protein PKG63_05120 [Bacteroidales bacterium]|jgi:PBP1b-binding outer membrane lipoprotein LpoB|nr:hypothetical protein [Bacteroidales bacterium]HNV95835.1 hypothetical protein [Bacteroidales bacterium]HOU97486.1 hypothetical protein [Bacteroidales bacterium]